MALVPRWRVFRCSITTTGGLLRQVPRSATCPVECSRSSKSALVRAPTASSMDWRVNEKRREPFARFQLEVEERDAYCVWKSLPAYSMRSSASLLTSLAMPVLALDPYQQRYIAFRQPTVPLLHARFRISATINSRTHWYQEGIEGLESQW